MYPASYDSVVSVAAVAVAPGYPRASFSNYNSEVDIAAPGVRVFSTSLPGSPEPFLTAPDGRSFGGIIWKGLGTISGQSGNLLDCGTGTSVCSSQGANGNSHICLMQRYAKIILCASDCQKYIWALVLTP